MDYSLLIPAVQIIQFDVWNKLKETNSPNDYGPFKGSAANHHFVIQNVLDTLNGEDTIAANALEGLKVVEIIERIYLQRKIGKLFTYAQK